jgi:hypothetical protein
LKPSSLTLPLFVTTLGLTLLLLVAGRPVEARPLLQDPGWTEVARVSGGGAWARQPYNAYAGGFHPYEPATGPYAQWWTESYAGGGSWGSGMEGWCGHWWGSPPYAPIPEIGRRAYGRYGAGCNHPNYVVDMHRQPFTLPPAYRVTQARVVLFSDNISTVYVNGTRIAYHEGGPGAHAFDPALLHGGSNLFAMAVHNDGVCDGCNPYGLQYLLEVYLAEPEPGVLTRDYPWLAWYGPRVGQPTQILRGTRFTPHGAVELQVLAGPDPEGDPTICGHMATYTLQADAAGEFVFTTAEAAQAYFGAQCRGGWVAQARDLTTDLVSNAPSWVVAWFPVRRSR